MAKIIVYVGKEIDAIRDFVNMDIYSVSVMNWGNEIHHTEIHEYLKQFFVGILGNDLQIRMHINSLEVISHLPSVLHELDLCDDFELIRIGRSVKTSNKDKMIKTHISAYDLWAMLEMNVEMR